MTEASTTTDSPTVELVIERFAHGADPARYAGNRGTSVTAATRFASSGRVFSTHFPTVFVTDSGDVELGEELLVPADDAIAWLRAVANHIEARRDAS